MLPRRVVLRSFGALGGALLIGGCSPGPLRIDVYRPEDREFFQPNRSAIEEISHPSVASLVAESFAVVTATIVDVVDLHEVRSSEDHFFEGGWVIEVHECVRSRGEPLAGRTIVSLLAGDSPLSDRPPVRLPKAVFLLFLRSNAESWREHERRLAERGQSLSAAHRAWRAATGDLYALINTQGICGQGEDHVVNSLRDPRDPDSELDRELASQPTLSGLIDKVRALR